MMGTEEQAKQWWCPMARVAFMYREQAPDAMLVCNRAETDFPIGNCIASKCAMWRWAYNDDGSQNDQSQSDTIGYCGLGGRP